MGKDHCEPPFWEDISVIFKHFTLQYDPYCKHQVWNFGVRLTLISLFIGMIGSVLGGLNVIIVSVLFGILTALVIIFTAKPTKREEEKIEEKKQHWDKYHELPYIAEVQPEMPAGYVAPITTEAFVNGGSSKGSVQPFSQPIGVEEVDAAPYSGGTAIPSHVSPTARNLFMNVLLDDIKYNPTRPSAESVSDPVVKQTFDDYFRVQWFSDPTDVFGKNQGQRQFVTQPSTSVPNNQGAFADWLYKIPGKTCKEGGRAACLPGTDGGAVTWLNQDS